MLAALIIGFFVVIIYYYSTRNLDYWRKKGVKHDKPIPLFGNNAKNYFMKRNIRDMYADAYWKYPNERVVGYFRSTRPELVIRDPQLVKQILLTDFSKFYARGINPHKTVVEPLLKNLVNADGDLWRLLRQRMTPAFTGGKLKAMFPLIVERAAKLQTRVARMATEGKTLDACDLMARYATDFIGACGFGIDADTLNEENSEFRKLGKKIFEVGISDIIVGILKETFPETFRSLKITYKYEDEVFALVRSILAQRNYEPSGRNDFVDILLEFQKKGPITVESLEKVDKDGKAEQISLELTEELIAAQMFIFFAAGFETSSSTTSVTLHQLAYHPEKQCKVQAEIDQVLRKFDNKLSYDAIQEMKYLEGAFKEGMRVSPSVGFLIRESTQPYTFQDLGFTIDRGIHVVVPIKALHNDPQYFENPSEYRPERFLPEELDSNKCKYVYMPFGEGPRACIGARLGLMQSLAGLAAILARFSVEPGPETVRDPPTDPRTIEVQSFPKGIPLLFKERKTFY